MDTNVNALPEWNLKKKKKKKMPILQVLISLITNFIVCSFWHYWHYSLMIFHKSLSMHKPYTAMLLFAFMKAEKNKNKIKQKDLLHLMHTVCRTLCNVYEKFNYSVHNMPSSYLFYLQTQRLIRPAIHHIIHKCHILISAKCVSSMGPINCCIF